MIHPLFAAIVVAHSFAQSHQSASGAALSAVAVSVAPLAGAAVSRAQSGRAGLLPSADLPVARAALTLPAVRIHRSAGLRAVATAGERSSDSSPSGAEDASAKASKPFDLTAAAVAAAPLAAARDGLYARSGGSLDSDRAGLARLDSNSLLVYIRSDAFKSWVASEKALGRQVFSLTDLDKTMGAGDIFTFFFDWRARNGKFTAEQNSALKASFGAALGKAKGREIGRRVVKLWKKTEEGKPGGISLLDFWRKAYWPSQVGMTAVEKQAQVTAFAPEYADRIFPGIREQNEALREAGAEVVIVSNGDQELARAVAPMLGIDPRNTVGASMLYGKDGRSTGEPHTYEIYEGNLASKPQVAKPLNFLYWVNDQRERWPDINRDKIKVAAMFGDSAAADGGAMVLLNPAIGYFIVDTPGEPKRRKKFVSFAYKYGGALGRGSFITVDYPAPAKGALP